MKVPRRTIITGASAGIGRGIAEVLAGAGHRVGLIARREERLREVAGAIDARGGTAGYAAADIRSGAETVRAIEALVAELGGLDGLIVNAGLVLRKSFLEITDDEWRRLVDTNVHGAYHTIKAALPALRENGAGHIIAISSISGRLPLEGGSAYAATKYALTGLAESLFLELRELGIKVTTVFPGSVDSESRRTPDADPGWKVTPAEVGEACRSILETRAENLIASLEIRPARKPAP